MAIRRDATEKGREPELTKKRIKAGMKKKLGRKGGTKSAGNPSKKTNEQRRTRELKRELAWGQG